MALTVQNLRSNISGVGPQSLLPGQICLNLADKTIYVGDGSSTKTKLDGSQEAAPAGEGWFETSLDSDYFLLNPSVYGPAPLDGQIIAYDGTIGKPVWSDGSTLTIQSSNVLFNTSGTGLPPSDDNVQLALSTVAVLAYDTEVIALGALQRTGGVMTGDIQFNPGQLIDAGDY